MRTYALRPIDDKGRGLHVLDESTNSTMRALCGVTIYESSLGDPRCSYHVLGKLVLQDPSVCVHCEQRVRALERIDAYEEKREE